MRKCWGAAATMRGEIMGTAGYMSPEQARGSEVDKRSDIWAFGVCLFEALSGRDAFEGDTISDRLASVLKEEPDWEALPPSLPPRLLALLRRCLRKSSGDRLRDIGEARVALGEILDDPHSTEAVAETAGSTRGLGAIGIAATVLFSLAVGFLVAWLVSRNADPPAASSHTTLV